MKAEGESSVPVGYVRRAHGIRGAVLIQSLTDAPDQRFVAGATFTTAGDSPLTLSVTSVRSHKQGLLLEFESIVDRTAAEALRGEVLTIPRSERRRLEDDEYWEDELVGLRVVGVDGSPLGTVAAVVAAAAQDRLAVAAEDGERVEVPFVDAIVREVRVTEGLLVVDPPEGLFSSPEA